MAMPGEFCGVREIVLNGRSGRRRGILSIMPAGFANTLTIARIHWKVEPHDQVNEHL